MALALSCIFSDPRNLLRLITVASRVQSFYSLDSIFSRAHCPSSTVAQETAFENTE